MSKHTNIEHIKPIEPIKKIHNAILNSISRNTKIEEIDELINLFAEYKNYESYGKLSIELLMTSIGLDNIELFESLLRYIDIDIQDENNNTALISIINNTDYYHNHNIHHLNLMNNHIIHILNHTKNINLVNYNDHCALHLYLVYVNQFDLFKTIGTNFTVSGYSTNTSSVTINIIKKMLDMGADIHAKSNRSDTILRRNIGNNSYDLVKLLLDNAKIDNVKITKIGIENIIEAVYRKVDYDLFELLLQYVDDINALTHSGYSVQKCIDKLQYNNSDVMELLIVHGLKL